jgi:hypothetical protein
MPLTYTGFQDKFLIKMYQLIKQLTAETFTHYFYIRSILKDNYFAEFAKRDKS